MQFCRSYIMLLLVLLALYYDVQDQFTIYVGNSDLSKTSHNGYVLMYNLLYSILLWILHIFVWENLVSGRSIFSSVWSTTILTSIYCRLTFLGWMSEKGYDKDGINTFPTSAIFDPSISKVDIDWSTDYHWCYGTFGLYLMTQYWTDFFTRIHTLL